MDPIFANHLFFMRRHRGDYALTRQSVTIASEAPGFTSWAPLSNEAVCPNDMDAVRLIPQSGDTWPQKLETAGFRPAEQLSYQDFDLSRTLKSASAFPVIRGETYDDALAFAEVQAAGFLEQNGDTAKWWSDFFRHVALRNIFDPAQDFLIASYEGEPAAILLLITQDDVSGIYAVATRPEARGQGLSTMLLHAAAERAEQRGAKRLVLQAMSGSYADGFYKRLGFSERYISTVWRRIQTP